MSCTISTYFPGASTATLHAIWQSAYASLHPAFSLPAAKLHQLINTPLAKVFLSTAPSGEVVGFVLTYLVRIGSSSPKLQHYKGTLAALVVSEAYQGRGVGTALHHAALAYLEPAVRDSLTRSTPPAAHSEIMFGSIVPRIFPGLPGMPAMERARAWFTKRGWNFLDNDMQIDLYGTLPTGVDQEVFKMAAVQNGIVLRPATPADNEAIMALQRENFEDYSVSGCQVIMADDRGGVDVFLKFLDHGFHRDILVAVDTEGIIIGSALASMPGSPIHDLLAWPCTLGERCGSISCVGVAHSARGKGAGVALVAEGIQDLTARGADGVFVDWVRMKNFYERFGLHQWKSAYWDASR